MSKRSLTELESHNENELIIGALKQVQDPELGLDVWNLELIYDIIHEADGVTILMTFTTPLCPYGPELVARVQSAAESTGVKDVTVEVVIDPVWEPSERVKLLLGIA